MSDEPSRDLNEVRSSGFETAIRRHRGYRRRQTGAARQPHEPHLPNEVSAFGSRAPTALELRIGAERSQSPALARHDLVHERKDVARIGQAGQTGDETLLCGKGPLRLPERREPRTKDSYLDFRRCVAGSSQNRSHCRRGRPWRTELRCLALIGTRSRSWASRTRAAASLRGSASVSRTAGRPVASGPATFAPEVVRVAEPCGTAGPRKRRSHLMPERRVARSKLP